VATRKFACATRLQTAKLDTPVNYVRVRSANILPPVKAFSLAIRRVPEVNWTSRPRVRLEAKIAMRISRGFHRLREKCSHISAIPLAWSSLSTFPLSLSPFFLPIARWMRIGDAERPRVPALLSLALRERDRYSFECVLVPSRCETPATVLLMMREEASAIKRAELSATTSSGGSSFTDLFLLFVFSPSLPSTPRHLHSPYRRRGEAEPCRREKARQHTYTPHLLCPENAR